MSLPHTYLPCARFKQICGALVPYNLFGHSHLWLQGSRQAIDNDTALSALPVALASQKRAQACHAEAARPSPDEVKATLTVRLEISIIIIANTVFSHVTSAAGTIQLHS